MSQPSEPLVLALRQEWSHLLKQVALKLDHCLLQLSDTQICQRPGPGMNSVANHIAHMTGNLYQWSVTSLTDEPDQRDREAEFRDLHPGDVMSLKMRLLSSISAAYTSINRVTLEQLLQTRSVQGFTVTGLQALNHTVTHLVGHTHQVVQLTRWHLGEDYQFHWNPDQPRGEVPL